MKKGRIKVDGREVKLGKTKRGGGFFACKQKGGQYTCMTEPHYFCFLMPISFLCVHEL